MEYYDEIVVVPSKDGNKRKLLKEITYHLGHLTIVVPKDFVTDFASVPRIFWSVISPIGKQTRAAVLHDFLYSKYNTYGINKTVADKIFYREMLKDGVNKTLATLMYTAVKNFGKPSFITPKIDGYKPYEDVAVNDRTSEAKKYYSAMAELLDDEYYNI